MPPKVRKKSSRPAESTPTRTRTRRSPEAARALILEAGTRLIARDGPNSVGLRDVAREAGVSHALVTHYFGTIEGLVNEALEAHMEKQRGVLLAKIESATAAGPRAWLAAFEQWLSEPLTSQLIAWALVTGRIGREDFFSRRQRGAKRVADAVEARLRGLGLEFNRADLEFVILLVLTASHGYTLGRGAFWASLGVDSVTAERDRFFWDRLGDVIESLVSGRLSLRER